MRESSCILSSQRWQRSPGISQSYSISNRISSRLNQAERCIRKVSRCGKNKSYLPSVDIANSVGTITLATPKAVNCGTAWIALLVVLFVLMTTRLMFLCDVANTILLSAQNLFNSGNEWRKIGFAHNAKADSLRIRAVLIDCLTIASPVGLLVVCWPMRTEQGWASRRRLNLQAQIPIMLQSLP